MTTSRAIGLCCALALCACLRPTSDNWDRDQVVGRAEVSGVSIDANGLAAIHAIDDDSATLWMAAPRASLTVRGITSPFTLRLRNIMPDATLRGAREIPRGAGTVVTEGVFVLNARDEGAELVLASRRAEDRGAHEVGVLSDIQDAVDDVGDIFARMNEDELDFVISTGDLTDNGAGVQLERVQFELAQLNVPFYSTVGNHEIPDPDAWQTFFGPFNIVFEHRGVAYSLIDSSAATIDPNVREEFLAFAERTRDQVHIFLTHVPIFDTSGIRSAGFRSRNEAARTVEELASRDVDALFFGHVHSYYAYDLAGIPAYISGGGGAIPERLDGVDRHYLRVRLEPDGPHPIESVNLIRVD